MREKILQLEQASKSLEPTPELRQDLARQALDFGESFLQDLPGAKTFEPDQGLSSALEQVFTEEAEELPDLLKVLDQGVIYEGIKPSSGGHMGYIPGGGIYPSALGDYLADVTNCYSGVAFASPGGVKMC